MTTFLIDMLATLVAYSRTTSNYMALECLAALREVIARAEQYHRSRIVRDVHDDEDL